MKCVFSGYEINHYSFDHNSSAWDLTGICGSRLASRNTFKNDELFSMNLIA